MQDLRPRLLRRVSRFGSPNWRVQAGSLCIEGVVVVLKGSEQVCDWLQNGDAQHLVDVAYVCLVPARR